VTFLLSSLCQKQTVMNVSAADTDNDNETTYSSLFIWAQIRIDINTIEIRIQNCYLTVELVHKCGCGHA
jgi:hypothetical protein